MREIETQVTYPSGLHARPAALFVTAAMRFQSVITVYHEGRVADAKSILSVLALGAGPGVRVTITAEGPDEEEAVHELAALLSPAPGAPVPGNSREARR